jgi:hypothetical protein
MAFSSTPRLQVPLCAPLWRIPQSPLQLWNVATASGSLNPDILDSLMEEDFVLHDLLGFTGDDADHLDHPYTVRQCGDRAAAPEMLLDSGSSARVPVLDCRELGGGIASVGRWRCSQAQRCAA